MKKSKIAFAVLGILALAATLVGVGFALALGFTVNVEAGGVNANALTLYAKFAKGIFDALKGTAGHQFPTSLPLVLSFVCGVVYAFFGLAWLIVGLILPVGGKKALGALYGFLGIIAAFVLSFGLFVKVPNGLAEVYTNGYVYDFYGNLFGKIAFFASIAIQVLIAFAFVTYIVYAASNRKANKRAKAAVADKAEPAIEEKVAETVKEESKVEEPKKEEPKPAVAPVTEEKPAKVVKEESKVEEPKPAVKKEAPKAEAKKAEPKKEAKPVEKKGPVVASKPEPKKAAPKAESKKEEAKPAVKKEAKPAAKSAVKKEAKPAAKASGDREVYKAYHVSQHADGGWQVKGAGSEKALKRFKTQAEAIKYAKEVSESQGTTYLVHSMKGKIRKA